MKIYEVRTAFDIQHVLADGTDQFNPRGGKLGEPIEDLELPTFYVDKPKNIVANFYSFNQNLWLFDNEARLALDKSIKSAGQLFQIDVEQVGSLNVLNVLERCDRALDHSQSRWRREGKKVEY